MGILGNMMVPSSCSRVLTSLGIRLGTVSVEEANNIIMGGVQCINSFF